MKIKCPECEEKFDVDKNEHDEGDIIECEECSAELELIIKDGKFKAKSTKDKYDDFEFDDDNGGYGHD